MPEIRTIQNTDRRISVIEDPNPTFNRIFIDTVQHDLATLTPSWTKSWHFNYNNIQTYSQGNNTFGSASQAGGTYNMGQSYGPGQGVHRRLTNSVGTVQAWPDAGPQALVGGSYSGYSGQIYPATDDGFFRYGIMYLQRGTISCFSAGDGVANTNGNAAGKYNGGHKSSLAFQYDTFHQSLLFNDNSAANAPYRAQKLFQTTSGSIVGMLIGDRGFGGQITNAVDTGYWSNCNDAWYLYTSDLLGSSSGAVYSEPTSNVGVGWPNRYGSTVVYEDAANNSLWTINTSKPGKPYPVVIKSYLGNSPVTYNPSGGSTAATFFGVLDAATPEVCQTTNYSGRRVFFLGADYSAQTYWVSSNNNVNGCPFNIHRMSGSNGTCFPLYTAIGVRPANTTGLWGTSFNTLTNLNLAPSNARRDAATPTRIVFYSPHFTDTNNLQPIRFTFNQITGNVAYDYCNVSYPGANGYSTYSAMLSNNGSYPTGSDQASAVDTYWHKPHQFTSNGNTYITFFMADQYATGNNTLQGNVIGSQRWNTPARRTVLTFQTASGTNDFALSYHSSFTFPTWADIPKNYMPINANGTVLIVPQSGKTSFLKWVDTANTGWNVSGTYNTEFRSLGLDTTNRIWGIAMDKNNGNIHIIANTIPVNVAVVMANTNFTYTGATLNTTAAVNAYDYTGSRLTANVTLTIDGGTMTFATNGSRTYTMTTSNTADTVVNLNISGGGLNNIYAAISV